MIQSLVPKNTSPFDSIRHVEDGCEYWSARELMPLLGYTQWRRFEDAVERAMIACKNSGQKPESNFADADKVMKKGRYGSYTVEDYHLTRYACYLVAMNSDPRKEEVSQAQTYFAMKTRQAELADTRQQAPIHTLTDAMRARTLENLRRVPEGYFSVQGELFKHLYNLEGLLNQAIVSLAMVEIAVGQHWSAYAREVVGVHENVRCKYTHVLQDGREVYAWVYPIQYVNSFASWLWEEYFPNHFPAYQQYRVQRLALSTTRRKKLLR